MGFFFVFFLNKTHNIYACKSKELYEMFFFSIHQVESLLQLWLKISFEQSTIGYIFIVI